MANWENARAEATETFPWLQPSSYVPDSTEDNDVQTTTSSKVTTKPAKKIVNKPKHEAEKYYPTNLQDAVVPLISFDAKQAKTTWGTSTIGE